MFWYQCGPKFTLFILSTGTYPPSEAHSVFICNKPGYITLECKLHLWVDFGVIFCPLFWYTISGSDDIDEDILYLCGWAGCRSRWPDDEPYLSLAGQPVDAHRTIHSDPWRAEGENKTSSHTAQHFTKLITTSLCFQFSDFFRLN